MLMNQIHSMKWKNRLTDEVDMSDLDNLDEQTTITNYRIMRSLYLF